MPQTSTIVSSARAVPTPNKNIKTTVEHYPKGINPDEHYYRIIIGVTKFNNHIAYLSYRKDPKYDFIVDAINFNTDRVNDKKFIFTENEYEDLLDYLALYDDTDLRSIAEIGKKEIDRFSLLPIIP